VTAPAQTLTAAAYAALLAAAVAAVKKNVRKLFHLYGVPLTKGDQEQMTRLLYRSTVLARTRTYDLGAMYLRGKGWDDPIPPKIEYRAASLAKLLDGVPDRTFVAGKPLTPETAHQPVAVEQAVKVAQRAIETHVQQPAREVVKQAADTQEGIGWARVLTGATSCAFCAMLASRGPIYTSERAALSRGGATADQYHPGCDCIADLVIDFDTWEHRGSYEQLEDLWQTATEHQSNKDARNAFRRTWDKKVRDGESEGFLSSQLQPPGGAE
jgi:TPR repeat protein